MLLIEAAARLIGEGVDCEVVIVGDGPMRGEAERLIDRPRGPGQGPDHRLPEQPRGPSRDRGVAGPGPAELRRGAARRSSWSRWPWAAR